MTVDVSPEVTVVFELGVLCVLKAPDVGLGEDFVPSDDG